MQASVLEHTGNSGFPALRPRKVAKAGATAIRVNSATITDFSVRLW